jgi:hypothetical protein
MVRAEIVGPSILSQENIMSQHEGFHGYVASKLRDTWIHNLLNKLRTIKRNLLRRSEGERLLLQQYVSGTGKQLNMKMPETFSEKLYSRMISWNRGHDPIFTQLADKYAARDHVAKKIGQEYLVRLLWHGTEPDAIPFDALPTEYVIKANHGSAQVIIVKGMADGKDIIQKSRAWLKSNYYWTGREHQYYDIKPRIMIEEYLKNEDGSSPLDYRFWCFEGVPEVIQVDNRTHDINPFFDTKWNSLDLHYRRGASRPAVPKPANLEQMLSMASNLSAGFGFVRIDLYSIGERVYFGEYTFTPAGSLTMSPKHWDLRLGQKWLTPPELG